MVAVESDCLRKNEEQKDPIGLLQFALLITGVLYQSFLRNPPTEGAGEPLFLPVYALEPNVRVHGWCRCSVYMHV